MIVVGSILLAAALVATEPGPTVLTWTGDGDGVSVDDPANWSGSPDGGSIDLANITEVLMIDDVTAEVGGSSGASTLNFVDQGGLEMHAGRLMRRGASQAIESGYVFVTGGTVERQWISNSSVRLEGTGRVEFSGAGDPVPNGTIIDLGSMNCGVDFLNETTSSFLSEHITKFRVNGAAPIYNVNIRVESYNEGNGCSVSVLPEMCQADLNGDLVVNGADLALVLVGWGEAKDDVADINNDGIVNGADLALILVGWGDCPVGNEMPECGSPKHCEILYPIP